MADLELRHRTRLCKNCGSSFSYPVGKGSDRTHCSPACRAAWRYSRRIPRDQWPRCSTPECGRIVRARTATKCNPCYSLEIKRRAGRCSIHKCTEPAVRVGHGLCEKHYYRVVTAAGPADLIPRVRLQTCNGYTLVKATGHPLAQASNGWTFEHRVVAYDKYGDGPHPCHWCGVSMDWKSIVIDHLNEVKTDNRAENVVVACTPCNRARGAMIPFIRKMMPHRIDELIHTFGHMRTGFVCEAAE